MGSRANLLGDLRAEADRQMLDRAFLETIDYRTLIGEGDRPVVIGRRGTGKSALAYRLQRHYAAAERTVVASVAPLEDQVIGLRSIAATLFGSKYKYLRAGSKIAWRYALALEALMGLANHYKFKQSASEVAVQHLNEWKSLGADVSSRLRVRLQRLRLTGDEGTRIGELASVIELNQVTTALAEVIDALEVACVLLIDRVDEGYEPDDIGIALMDGLALAVIDLNTRFDRLRPILFLRDNIARAVAHLDEDYAREIEGQVLRLHWDENQLFSLVCNRIRQVFNLDVENETRVWNRSTARELQGRDGFKRCLRLTLYRPRDILALLNDAFLIARASEREQIVPDDVDATARTISKHRLADLNNEYAAILPGLEHFTRAFIGAPPEMSVREAYTRIENAVSIVPLTPAERQTVEILSEPVDIAAGLYSVGFLGLKDPITGVAAFCHDGRLLDRDIKEDDRTIVHPCYWMALGMSDHMIEQQTASEIFDDYEVDVKVVSQTPEVRKAGIGRLMSDLDKIPTGQEGAAAFENWCLRVLRILYPTQLTNWELHPNRVALQRRDVVATNIAEKGAWRRIFEDYKTRSVVFEVKNYANIAADEFRQVASYLHDSYGSCGFIVTRDNSDDLVADVELGWVRELYNTKRILVIKLTGRTLARQLSKLRSPTRHDEADQQLNKLVDRYVRLYLGQPSSTGKPKAKRRK